MNTNGSVRRKENVMTWLPVFHAIRMVVFLHLLKGEPIRKSLARGFHNINGLTCEQRGTPALPGEPPSPTHTPSFALTFTAQPTPISIKVPRCRAMYSESAKVLIQAMCPST